MDDGFTLIYLASLLDLHVTKTTLAYDLDKIVSSMLAVMAYFVRKPL